VVLPVVVCGVVLVVCFCVTRFSFYRPSKFPIPEGSSSDGCRGGRLRMGGMRPGIDGARPGIDGGRPEIDGTVWSLGRGARGPMGRGDTGTVRSPPSPPPPIYIYTYICVCAYIYIYEYAYIYT